MEGSKAAPSYSLPLVAAGALCAGVAVGCIATSYLTGGGTATNTTAVTPQVTTSTTSSYFSPPAAVGGAAAAAVAASSSSLSLADGTTTGDVLLAEQFARNISFLGNENFAKLRKAFVVVVGLGGVGSHAVNMVARSGVGKIRLIDFDHVTLSSLNRHAIAVRDDVGRSKVSVVANFLRRIIPDIEIDERQEMYRASSAASLLEGSPDYVIDCIDNTPTKVSLLEYCFKNKIKVVCSFGAGARADPSRMVISDITETRVDPLARIVRMLLRKAGVQDGIPTVYSTEDVQVDLVEVDDELPGEPEEYAPVEHFRSRILPVMGTVPAAFGNLLAAHVLMDLAGMPIGYGPVNSRPKTYQKMHHRLLEREKKLYNCEMYVSVSDVGYIVDEMWRGRSVISDATTNLVLARWDCSQPTTLYNLVAITEKESEAFEAATKATGSVLPRDCPFMTADQQDRVARILEIERRYGGVSVPSHTWVKKEDGPEAGSRAGAGAGAGAEGNRSESGGDGNVKGKQDAL